MALPPASERGISPAPEVKLTHTMTSQDVIKISKVTGGTLQEGTPFTSTYNSRGEKGFPTGIRYPEFNAELDFVGGPIAAVSFPQAVLNVDKNLIQLNNSAVVIGEDSVTFVRRPEAETDAPFEPTANVSTVTISKDGISYQKTRTERVRDENIVRAAAIVDKAYSSQKRSRR